jgi:hypothetical protein
MLHGAAMTTVLRVWLLGTAAFLAGAMIWAFVPVLVPIIALTVGIGGLVVVIVGFARWLERYRGVRHDM